MCNLYSMMSNKEAIAEFTRFLRVTTNAHNLGALPDIFAGDMGPVVRNTPEGRELTMARWGMPGKASEVAKLNYDSGVTNVRNPDSFHWQRWLDVENRCVVPVTSFCEPDQGSGSKENTWFAISEERPLFFFAGIWVPQWTRVRKVSEGETTEDLYAFLTTDANTEVKAIHPKAMPVLLRTPASVEYWLTADIEDALDLQKPAADGTLEIVSRGKKYDPSWAEPTHKKQAPPAKPQMDLF